MNEQQKRGPGRPPDPNTPKRVQVHLYLPEELHQAIRDLIGQNANMNTWLVDAAKEKLKYNDQKL
jgi:hypothetical protein